MNIIVIGAGGHGQVVADATLAWLEAGPMEGSFLGYADDDSELWGRCVGAGLVLGSVAQALATPHDAVVVAIGDNRRRQALTARLAAQGESFATIVHPAASVSPRAVLGAGCMVLAGAVINAATHVGEGVIVNTLASLDHHNTVGDFCHVAPGSHTGGNVTLAEGAFVGIGASILPQRTVGAWATVGAGATVIHDVPAHATVVGTPARVI